MGRGKGEGVGGGESIKPVVTCRQHEQVNGCYCPEPQQRPERCCHFYVQWLLLSSTDSVLQTAHCLLSTDTYGSSWQEEAEEFAKDCSCSSIQAVLQQRIWCRSMMPMGQTNRV